MTAAATIQKPTAVQPLLSAGTHLAAAFGVAALVTLAWAGAGQASHQAVETNTAVLARTVTHITLPPGAVKVSAVAGADAS